MQYRFSLRILFFVALIAVFVSCKKKEPAPPATPEPAPTETGQSSEDNRETQSEIDVAIGDINTIISDEAKLRGRVSSAGSGVSSATICGVSVDTTHINTGSLTINFTGTTCNNRTRTGTIGLSIQNYVQGDRWKKPGCVISVEFRNYKITRASDQKSIELNGTHLVTNVSGGTWWELLVVKTQTSLVTSVAGSNLKVKFDNNKEATYNINRRITYSIPGNIFTCTAEGTGSSGGLNNLENFGTTRDGDAFTSQVSTPIMWNVTCGAHAPLQGEVNMQVAGKSFALNCLFGTDASGNPVSVGANQCPFGWKLSWTHNGQGQSKVFGYK